MARPRNLKRFGEFLRKRRKAKNLSAEQVVLRMQRLGVELKNSTLYNWEAGTVKSPDLVALWAIAQIYAIKLERLIEVLIEDRNGQRDRPIPPDAVREETDEERLLVRIRGLRADARRRILDQIGFEEHKQGQLSVFEDGPQEKKPKSPFRDVASDSQDHHLE